MPTYSIKELCQVVEGTLVGNANESHTIRYLLTDSRRLVVPTGTLFVALVTENNDGHRYISELISKGVTTFLVSSIAEGSHILNEEVVFVLVGDTLSALQAISIHHRKSFDIPVLGITGSNGKTIVKEWLYQIVSEKKSTVCSPHSYNSQIGVPLSVWQLEKNHEFAIFEAGISQPGEMEKLERIISPTICIFTNIGPAHDEGFPDRASKIKEKLNFFVNTTTLICRGDDSGLYGLVKQFALENKQTKIFRWSFYKDSDLWVAKIEKRGQRSTISLVYGGADFSVEVPFVDEASIENVLHCIAFLCLEGYDTQWIGQKVCNLQPVQMRMEVKEGINNCLVINDSYNNDISSLSIAIDFLNSQTRYSNKTLILSDVLQTGVEKKLLYSEIASMLEAKGVGRLIGIGWDISAQRNVFKIGSVFFETPEKFLQEFDIDTFGKEAILIKGARKFGFEKISNLLQKKDHQTVLEVNLDSLIHNLNVFRSFIGDGVKVIAMVKAFSYGSGNVEVAGSLQYHHIDYLAVAYADEGKELRAGGIHIPIIVLNPEIRSLDVLFKYDLEPEVYSFEILERIARCKQSYNGLPDGNILKVHVKIDTGMHSLGFQVSEIENLVKVLKSLPYIKVASVFSHLAASDDVAHDEFTLQQISTFEDSCKSLKQGLGYEFMRHICNSAAAVRFPQAQFDAVRLGIGLYGISSVSEIKGLLKNVSTFRSVVSQVKKISKGESVGYNREAFAKTDMEIAIVPVGYADGLKRSLSNGVGKLFVKGRLVPTVGIISMDMCAIDISGMDVKPGDEVVVFGENLPATTLAEWQKTIPYEVLTSVSQRVKRVYFRE